MYKHLGKQIEASWFAGMARRQCFVAICCHMIVFGCCVDDAGDKEWTIWSQPVSSLHGLAAQQLVPIDN